jgi:hypothetical protein
MVVREARWGRACPLPCRAILAIGERRSLAPSEGMVGGAQ